MKYETYMASKEWERRREAFFRLKGGKCQQCGRRVELQVHHLNYERLWNERDQDLMVLCTRCHNDVHFAMRQCVPTERTRRQATLVSRDEFRIRLQEVSKPKEKTIYEPVAV